MAPWAAAAAALTLAVADRLTDDELDYATYTAVRDGDWAAAVANFREVTRRDADDAFAHMWLGQASVQQDDLAGAERAFERAVSTIDDRMPADDAEEKWARSSKKAQFELSLRRLRERRAALPLEGALSCAADGGGPRAGICSSAGEVRIEPIPRVHWRELSHERFATEFARARKPVVIVGTGSLTRENMSSAVLRETCGTRPAPVRRLDAASRAWAGLEWAGHRTFAEHLDALENGEPAISGRDGSVVFDWSLRNSSGCTPLLDGLSVPSYFSSRVLQAYGPSLFAQGRGTTCGAHVDVGETHFWQFVSQGHKRWRILAPREFGRIFDPEGWKRAFFRDPRCADAFGDAAAAAADCDDGFGAAADIFDDARLRRLVAPGTSPLVVREAMLGPGDLIFVPAGSPHQVVNAAEGAVIALSMNYVDETNLDDALRYELENGPVHPKYRSRLRKGGQTVPGSKARWHERFHMPWSEGNAYGRLRAIAALVDARRTAAARNGAADVPRLEPWSAFAALEWNLRDHELVALQRRSGGECADSELSLGDAPGLGGVGASCDTFIPTLASANEVSPPVICGLLVADVASALSSAGVAWTPPPHAVGGTLADVCRATCGAYGVGATACLTTEQASSLDALD